MNISFWTGKSVLITGHTGFKGSWLSLWLQKLGAKVFGYALPPPTKPSLFEIAKVAEGMTSNIGDTRDLKHLQDILNRHKPEILIHLAAQPIVRYSYQHPVETFSTNIMGAVNVLEAVRQSDSVRVSLIITSDKCYQNREWIWGYRENDPVGGHDPYSSSKGCVELVVAAYRDSYFTRVSSPSDFTAIASTRAGNVVGGGDWSPDRLIPDIMKSIMEKSPVNIRNPKAIRPWQHVLEPLCGYLTLTENLWDNGKEFCGAWNFGPDDVNARPVSWVTDHLTRLWGQNASWVTDSNIHPHEDTYLKLDSSKAKTLLNWRPQLDITETIKWIVEWYQAYLQKKNMRQYTVNQISRYEELLQQKDLHQESL